MIKLILKNCIIRYLKNPVSNSLKEIKQSVLITGSNMSGKTTFIKTLGVNIILAQNIKFLFGKINLNSKLNCKNFD